MSQQQGIIQVGQQPHAGGADSGLNILQRHVVLLPRELTADALGDHGDVAFYQLIYIKLQVIRPKLVGHCPGGAAGCLGA